MTLKMVKDGMAEGGFPGESLESIRSISAHEFSSKFLIYILKLTEERIKYTEVEILDGEVREQETVHIIMRASTKGLKKNWLSTKLVVASFKQDEKVWKLLSPAEIQGLVNFYRAKYSLKQE
ncbi:hypothetical protein [Zooshikella ganghwensis]|uniref:Uncharacterized protein n=1 Tax=Zooshikella ganghwensis TaxID=202772 RepID=A0A4P9VPB3_9GAMM|nr:hypothetical protein [Zooshikella ganghwensis]RDH44766.1 hypothetical protein B9G39_15730 [Zooshikella ganghwensis]